MCHTWKCPHIIELYRFHSDLLCLVNAYFWGNNCQVIHQFLIILQNYKFFLILRISPFPFLGGFLPLSKFYNFDVRRCLNKYFRPQIILSFFYYLRNNYCKIIFSDFHSKIFWDLRWFLYGCQKLVALIWLKTILEILDKHRSFWSKYHLFSA